MPRFCELWRESIAAAPAARSLKVVAVSFPDLGADTGLAIVAMDAAMGIAGTSAGAGRDGGGGDDGSEEGGKAETINVWQVQ